MILFVLLFALHYYKVFIVFCVNFCSGMFIMPNLLICFYYSSLLKNCCTLIYNYSTYYYNVIDVHIITWEYK